MVSWSQPAAAPVQTKASESAALVRVNGMVCDFCVRAVQQTFRKQAEVASVAVDLDQKIVRIGFKPGKTLPEAKIRDLIKRSGYAFVSLERVGA
jgi:copper chaperone CopZ